MQFVTYVATNVLMVPATHSFFVMCYFSTSAVVIMTAEGWNASISFTVAVDPAVRALLKPVTRWPCDCWIVIFPQMPCLGKVTKVLPSVPTPSSEIEISEQTTLPELQVGITQATRKNPQYCLDLTAK